MLVIDIQIASFTLLKIAKVARQCSNNSSNTLTIHNAASVQHHNLHI
jgi:hypothetical protein